MLTLSPPVSPSVVARILMIQKPSVIAGTLLSASRARSRSVMPSPLRLKVAASDATAFSMPALQPRPISRDPFSPPTCSHDLARAAVDSDFLHVAALLDIE